MSCKVRGFQWSNGSLFKFLELAKERKKSSLDSISVINSVSTKLFDILTDAVRSRSDTKTNIIYATLSTTIYVKTISTLSSVAEPTVTLQISSANVAHSVKFASHTLDTKIGAITEKWKDHDLFIRGRFTESYKK